MLVIVKRSSISERRAPFYSAFHQKQIFFNHCKKSVLVAKMLFMMTKIKTQSVTGERSTGTMLRSTVVRAGRRLRTRTVSSNELYAMQVHKYSKCACLKQLRLMLGPLTHAVLGSTLFPNKVSGHIHIAALYIEAIMKSWVSQLVKTHGEM